MELNEEARAELMKLSKEQLVDLLSSISCRLFDFVQWDRAFLSIFLSEQLIFDGRKAIDALISHFPKRGGGGNS